MNQEQYTPSQLQEMIQKYQNELMASYKRKKLSDTQKPEQSAKPETPELGSEPRKKFQQEPRQESENTPVRLHNQEPKADDREPAKFGAPPAAAAPSVFVPSPVAVSSMVQSIMSNQPEQECSPSPSMFRPNNVGISAAVALEKREAVQNTPQEPNLVEVSNLFDDDSPLSPSMFRPQPTIQTSRVNGDLLRDTPVDGTPASFMVEDDCPPAPSMFRPVQDTSAVSQETNQPVPANHSFVSFPDDECPTAPSKFRPFRADKKAVLASMPKPDSSKPANLQVKVTSGRNPVPIYDARVTITRAGFSTQKVHKTVRTDGSGSTPVVAIPLCDPPAPCTIEVSANGYCGARYSGIPLYNGITAIQYIDLIPLPSGQKDLTILFQESRKHTDNQS